MEVDILILQETNEDWDRVINNNAAIKSKFKYIRVVNDKYGVQFLQSGSLHILGEQYIFQPLSIFHDV